MKIIIQFDSGESITIPNALPGTYDKILTALHDNQSGKDILVMTSPRGTIVLSKVECIYEVSG